MLSHLSRSVVVVGWMGLLAIIVAVSIVMGADRSTTAVLLALSTALGIVALLLAGGARSESVAEILHAVESKERR
jgi:Mrp family chromosome partitioning ATPase